MRRPPVKISILVLDESTMLTVASVIDPMRAANRLAGSDLFQWQLFACAGRDISLTGDVTMVANDTFNDACAGDVLLLIASFNQRKNAAAATIQTLRRVAGKFSVICGIEAGTWLLARAGLVTTHRVTTHWEDFENLAQQYPSLSVVSDRFVIDGKFRTCGGANPALDMMLELIADYYDRVTSLQVASVFIYDQSHTAADAQPVHSLGLLKKREPRIAEAMRIMEEAIEEPIAIGVISTQLNLSTRMLEQLFRRHLNKTPSEYYLLLRLTAARKMIVDSNYTIQQISVLTGFSSQSSFSRAFKKVYQLSPRKLRP